MRNDINFIYDKCEKYLEKHFYHTWIDQENEKEQVEVDKWTIGG